jgi:hypothetical protein
MLFRLKLIIKYNFVGFGLYFMVIEGMTQLFNGDLGFTCIALLTSF